MARRTDDEFRVKVTRGHYRGLYGYGKPASQTVYATRVGKARITEFWWVRLDPIPTPALGNKEVTTTTSMVRVDRASLHIFDALEELAELAQELD